MKKLVLFCAAAVLVSGAPAFAQSKALIDAAKKEGQLTVIALPHDWVNYGEAISTFSKKYGITINELNPDGGSGDEIEAIKANKDNKGPQAPDVIDVGLSFGPQAKADGLLMNYKVSTWDTIPKDVKDADGAWYGDYYGALAFEYNKSVVKNPPRIGPICSSPSSREKSPWREIPRPPTRPSWPSWPRAWPTAVTSRAPTPVSSTSPS